MKRLIYIGAIFEWMDVPLVEKLCEQHQVMMVGEKRIALPPAVNYIGKVPITELPRYILQNDAGIVPFIQNELTRDINNSKIYQFYALGLPVVTTLNNHAYREAKTLIGETHEEFLKKIEMTDQVDRRELVAIARQHDWQRKADKFAEVLKGL